MEAAMRAHLGKGLALVCLAAALVPSLAEQGEKGKKKAWEGTWQCLSKVVDGKKQDAGGWLVMHEGDRYTLKKDDKVVSEGTNKRDKTVTPHTVDTTPSSGPGKGKTAHGIYEIKGDTMRLCLAPAGKERPNAFASPEGSSLILETWKRVPVRK
jgi:uncharacterized protein (TIGR03067 family)